MSVKDSMDKVKKTKDQMREDFEETRKTMRDMRPRPLRKAVDNRMTDIRPLKRIRKRLSSIGKEG